MAKVLESQFPHLSGHIDGKNYVSSPWKSHVAFVLSALRWIGLALLLVGEAILKQVGVPYDPAIFATLKEHHFAGILFFMGLGIVAQNMTTSGAFEVFLNGKSNFSSRLMIIVC